MSGGFADRLAAAIAAKGSPVCLGIDPQLEHFPQPLVHLASSTNREVAAAAIQRFCDELLEAVSDVVPVVKPQVAFFERLGPPGWIALERVVSTARARGLLVLADAKRGDMASTATAYADYFFGDPADPADTAPRDATRVDTQYLPGLGADAMTVSPYLGGDSLEPFLRHVARGKGLYLLAKTSNPGSRDLQDLRIQGDDGERAPARERPPGRPLYAHAAALATRLGSSAIGTSGFSSVGIVVGATFPSESRELRFAHPSLQFLVPGYGAQGAGPDDIVTAFDDRRRGAIVSASRSLLFAYRAERHRELGEARWAEASRRECIAMRDAIAAALDRRRVDAGSDAA